jgi:hypothetical protein
MNEFNIRRRLASDGIPDDEIEDLLSDMAEQRNDEERDRQVEEHFRKPA